MRAGIQLFAHLLTPAARRFEAALQDPQAAQQRVQAWICDRLIASPYGQSLGIRSLADWEKIPIVDYEALRPWIFPTASVPPDLPHSRLTPDPVLFYERTAGTQGAAKWIPYTPALRRSFNHLFCVWAQDLIRQGPTFSRGKLYFCISPQFAGSSSALQDDSAYLDGWLRWLLRPFWVGVDLDTPFASVAAFQHQLAISLLQEAHLEIISIWSPSFLPLLLDYIQTHQVSLRREANLSPRRDRLLAATPIPWTELWRDLKLISCWDSVASADPADSLRSRFPGVLVQGKGLLATEAPMTVPLLAAHGYVPLLDEVFFEFQDPQGNLHRLHQLQGGQDYTIILSQKGGLYRYNIGDRVRVSHFYQQTPCLEFLGRTAGVSDLVGEKLTETFVQQILAQVPLADGQFRCLAPVLTSPPHYWLLLDRSDRPAPAIAALLDTALCQNPQYHHARQLGQLAPPRVLIHPTLPGRLIQCWIAAGKVWGDLKHPLLLTTPLPAEWCMALLAD